MTSRQPWDLFCRVVDNLGDIGVCWRLAADLASRGESVRLWVDDASALAWMAPGGAPRVSVLQWPELDPGVEPGAGVVEAFGCELPPFFVARMARSAAPPVWINLEYLSAEAYVERVHRLPSPQRGAAAGLRKWFFYPGFTTATGGLLRERGLDARRSAFNPAAWLAARQLVAAPGERVVSLFCYEQPRLPDLIAELAQAPTLLLATAGHAARQVGELLGGAMRRGALRAHVLPLLTQRDYDHLLWTSDLNVVRGEDSFVRAQWAGAPFLWQPYAQQDGVHRAKLEAFLARFLATAEPALAAGLGRAWRAWNGSGGAWMPLPAPQPWREHCTAWRAALQQQDDLGTQLCRFVAESR